MGAPGACCARCCASATMLARYCRMRLITSGSDSATMYFLPSTSVMTVSGVQSATLHEVGVQGENWAAQAGQEYHGCLPS